MSKTDAELAAKTDEALRQMADRIRAATIEECAKIADASKIYGQWKIAEAIRALKEQK